MRGVGLCLVRAVDHLGALCAPLATWPRTVGFVAVGTLPRLHLAGLMLKLPTCLLHASVGRKVPEQNE